MTDMGSPEQCLKQRADVPGLPSAPPMLHLFVFLDCSAESRAAKNGNKGAHPHPYGPTEPRQQCINVRFLVYHGNAFISLG